MYLPGFPNQLHQSGSDLGGTFGLTTTHWKTATSVTGAKSLMGS